MKELTLLNDNKSYHVGDVIENFVDYFGISFEEVMNLFSNYKIIEEKNIIDYVKNNYYFMWENRYPDNRVYIDEIIKSRLEDYNILKNNLVVLGHKGMNYLSLLDYVAKVKDIYHENDFYELVFDQLGISHFGRGMRGDDINKILLPLYNIVMVMMDLLDNINCLDKYRRERFDFLAKSYKEQELYVIDSVVIDDDNFILDKTSFGFYKTRRLGKK